MEIDEIRALKGANYYSYQPVLRVEIDLGKYEGIESCKLMNFNDRLLFEFPGLKEHYCSLGRPGGFVERLQEGTFLGHVMEHLILELQNLLGYDVFYGCTRRANELGRYYVVVEYENEQVATFFARKALEIIYNLAQGRDIPDRDKILKQAREIKDRYGLGPSTEAIIDEAKRMDIPVLPLSEEDCFFQLGYGKYQQRIQATITSSTSCIGVDTACDKWRTKTLLQQFEIPVPRGLIVSSQEELTKAVNQLGLPVVIKPFNANQGKGVSSNLNTPQEIWSAFEIAREYSSRVIVESCLPGYDYRLLVVGNRLVAASRRIPPFVIGDGRHSIRQLVARANKSPERGEGHEKPLTKIKIDSVVLLELYRQGLKLDDILPRGKKVYLRRNGNLSTGGLPVDVTDEVHPENAELAVRAAKILGLDLAGVDMITPDISIPVTESGGGVIEVNAAPGIRMHLYPYKGRKRNVASSIVRHLFPKGTGRIPIVAITGTNGKTTVARILNYLLDRMGLLVGLSSTDGIYIGGRKMVSGDTTGYGSCQRILKDPDVEAAVLETARGGILKNGLGFDYCDVGIITNIRGDHLGQGEIETLDDLAHLKSLIIERVRKDGYAVLNAEDRYAGCFMKRARGQVVLCSTNPDNILVWKYVYDGGRAVIADRDRIKVIEEGEEYSLLPLKDIPLTGRGSISYQVENVVLAVGGALSLNIPLEIITDGLKEFGRRPLDNPGRFTRIENSGRKIIIDYGHNPDGIDKVLKTVVNMNREGRVVGIICSPGDRRDEDIMKIGWLAGTYLDGIIIKEDADTRGRRRGEVASLLKKGVIRSNFAGPLKIIYDEKEAVLYALEKLREKETLVIFYEKDFNTLYELASSFDKFIEYETGSKPVFATRST